MEPSVSPIVIGVASGVLTAAFLFLVKTLFQNSLLPWYRAMLYSGIDLEGTWYSHSLSVQKVVLELTQKCEVLSGKATYVLEKDSDPDVDTIRTFNVTGEIKGKFVLFNLFHTDKQRIGVVSYLLEVSGDGTKLTGESSGYNPSTEEISSFSFSAYRDPLKAAKSKEKYKDLSHEELQDVIKRQTIVFPGTLDEEEEE